MEKSNGLGRSGFTLLEVLIAMAIMLLAFTSILATESSSINASERTKRLNVVAMLARNRMIETEQAFEGKTFDEVKKEEADTFKAPYEDYRWTSVVKEVTFPNLSTNTSDEKGGGAASGRQGEGNTEIADLLTKLITKYLSKSLREVTVTIFWKRGSSEQNFAISTYWVDLNHEFELTP